MPGVALQLCFGAQREERQHELVERRNRRMREDGRLLGIDACGQVVHHHVVYVVLDMLGCVAVGDDLIVGDEHVALNAEVLVLDAMLDAAKVVTKMQTTRRAVAREHRVLFGMQGQVSADVVGTLLRSEECVGKFGHAYSISLSSALKG